MSEPVVPGWEPTGFCQTSEKLPSQQQHRRKISSKYQVLSGSLVSRMKSPASVELHQIQGVYRWSSSISWSEAYEERKRGGENSKQKTRSDHNRDECSTSWTILSIGRISLLVCTLSPSAFLPLHFFHLSTLKALHWTGIFPGPFRFQVHCAHDAHHPPSGAGTGIPHLELLGVAFSLFAS